jgi:hypothetical protein
MKKFLVGLVLAFSVFLVGSTEPAKASPQFDIGIEHYAPCDVVINHQAVDVIQLDAFEADYTIYAVADISASVDAFAVDAPPGWLERCSNLEATTQNSYQKLRYSHSDERICSAGLAKRWLPPNC